MFYHLNSHCKLVAGANKCAIYDFNSGKVYSINFSAFKLLNECQQKRLDAMLDVSSPDYRTCCDFLNQLVQKNILTVSNQPAASEPTCWPVDYEIKLEFIWLEITACCNNKCLHCYSESGPKVTSAKYIPHKRWLEIIHEAREAGARDIQLIGGEPLLYPNWRDLIIKARQENYDIVEIFTNATLIDQACIDFFKKYDVAVATTIYADNPAGHDAITQNPGSFEKTMAAIYKLKENKIPLRIASVVMKTNEDQVDGILKLYNQLGMKDAEPDVVRPSGRGSDEDILPKTYRKRPIQPPFFTDKHSFIFAHHYHSCLAGKAAITSEGDVLPCIFARNTICGNILDTPLGNILTSSKLQACWKTTKDQIPKCKDCEFRYCCPDCRPLAQGIDPEKKWLAPPVDCLYNPYAGTWNPCSP